jgi:hypothetical protein
MSYRQKLHWTLLRASRKDRTCEGMRWEAILHSACRDLNLRAFGNMLYDSADSYGVTIIPIPCYNHPGQLSFDVKSANLHHGNPSIFLCS